MAEGKEGQRERFLTLLIGFVRPIPTGVSLHSALCAIRGWGEGERWTGRVRGKGC